LEERNWRPNIILFSGGGTSRPHLVQFGKDLVVNQGLLSNFDLLLNRSAKVLLKKHQQTVKDQETLDNEGIFTRRHECQDIYEGIETIAGTYGFSGVEPNTVLMGWARQSQEPKRFAQMIKNLSDLDLNIVMIDYDKERGFGNYKQIDVWCRGGGNNCSFVLSLVRFIWLSDNWKNAKLRILMINPVNDDKDELYEGTHENLEKLRIDAEVKIINNQIEQRPVYDIMQIESSDSDLVFLGIPDVMDGQEFKYVDDVNHLCQNIGTVALVKASSYFTDFNVNTSREGRAKDKYTLASEKGPEAIVRRLKNPEVRYPEQAELSEALGKLYADIKFNIDNLGKKCFTDLFSFHPKIIDDIRKLTARHFEGLLKVDETGKLNDFIDQTFFRMYLGEANEILKLHRESLLADQKEILSSALKEYIRDISGMLAKQPKTLIKLIPKDDLKIYRKDPFSIKRFKLGYMIKGLGSKKPVKYKIQYNRLLEYYIPYKLNEAAYEILQNWGLISLQFTTKIQKNINGAIESILLILEKERKGEHDTTFIHEEMERIDRLFVQLQELNEASLSALNSLILNKFTYIFQQISNDVIYLRTNGRIQKPVSSRRIERRRKEILAVTEEWKSNQYLNFESIFLNNQILMCQAVMRKVLTGILTDFGQNMNINVRKVFDLIYNAINRDERTTQKTIKEYENMLDPGDLQISAGQIQEVLAMIPEEISKDMSETCHLFSRSKFEDYKTTQFEDDTRMTLPAEKIIRSMAVNEFTEPLAASLDSTMEAFMALLPRIEPAIAYLKESEMKGLQGMDMPEEGLIRKNKLLKELDQIITDHETIVKGFDNRLKERITALTDRFTFNSMIGYYRVNRRKIK
jgi:hypothetical protein